MVDIALSQIRIPPKRLRALRAPVVDGLADSIAEQGLLHPILVRPEGNRFVLIAGLHRIEAHRKLGLEAIWAEIRDGGQAQLAELAEIDENLMRAELSSAERSLHLIKRKEIYEELHPETKKGGDRKSKEAKSNRQNGALIQTFTADAADKTGQSERTVQREVKRGNDLGEQVLRQVMGTALDKPDQLDALAKMDHREMDELVERAQAGETINARTELKKQKRAAREIDLATKLLTLPDIKFGVIVEDLEWDFSVWSRETGMDRHAANHYPVAADAHSAAELHERTKDRFANAADDCVLWMWTTVPHLKVALELMELRGFKYVSNYVWGKDRVGTGYWSRNKHEHLLIGTRGNVVAPAPGTQHDSLIEAPVGEHSAKPERFLEIIEGYYPTVPKLELNRRGPPRPGWYAWGNEAEPQAEAAE